jgi:hypothetical protein
MKIAAVVILIIVALANLVGGSIYAVGGAAVANGAGITEDIKDEINKEIDKENNKQDNKQNKITGIP